MLPAFFHQTPFFRLLLPFITGIVAGFYFTIPAECCMLACSLSMLGTGILLWKWKRLGSHRWGWLYGIFLNVFLLAAGIGTVSLHSSVPVEQAEQGAWLVVVDEPPTEKENSMKATVHIRANLTNEPVTECDELVITYFRKDSLARQIRQGDLLVMNAALKPVANAGNPYEFDYRSYLSRKHISRSAFVESGHWQLLDSYAQGPVFNFSNRIRNNLLDVFKRAGLNGNELAVASALVLGYTADLDDALYGAYAASGAMHVLSVSGLHVAIVYMILIIILKPFLILHRVKWLRALMVLVALWLYALITGMSPSVMRATTMFSFIVAGEAFRRKAYIYNSIAASAFILLLANPNNLFDVGFQLSYIAVLAIVILYPHLYGLLSFHRWLPDQAWSLACVSVAAQIGTAPLALCYFHQFPVYFLLTNFIVIPISSIIIYGSVLLLFIAPVRALLEPIGWMLDKVIYFFNSCIFFIEKLPGSVIWGIRFHGWAILISYLLIAAVGIWMLTARRAALFTTVVLILLWVTAATIETNRDLHRQQLVVYHTQGNSLLYFIDGRDNTVWHVGRNPSFNVPRMIEGQRIAMHLDDARSCPLDSALHMREKSHLPGLYHNGNFIQFAGKCLAIFTRNMPPQDAGQQSIHTDVAILTQNINVHISQIIGAYHPGVVVLDASNTQARIDRWEKECAEAGVKCHRVDRNGAFILTR